jgi:hypothetical protein
LYKPILTGYNKNIKLREEDTEMVKVDWNKVRESKRYKAAKSRLIDITMSCDVYEALNQICSVKEHYGKDVCIGLACEDLRKSIIRSYDRKVKAWK